MQQYFILGLVYQVPPLFTIWACLQYASSYFNLSIVNPWISTHATALISVFFTLEYSMYVCPINTVKQLWTALFISMILLGDARCGKQSRSEECCSCKCKTRLLDCWCRHQVRHFGLSLVLNVNFLTLILMLTCFENNIIELGMKHASTCRWKFHGKNILKKIFCCYWLVIVFLLS